MSLRLFDYFEEELGDGEPAPWGGGVPLPPPPPAPTTTCC
jgi:hypothetical protein